MRNTNLPISLVCFGVLIFSSACQSDNMTPQYVRKNVDPVLVAQLREKPLAEPTVEYTEITPELEKSLLKKGYQFVGEMVLESKSEVPMEEFGRTGMLQKADLVLYENVFFGSNVVVEGREWGSLTKEAEIGALSGNNSYIEVYHYTWRPFKADSTVAEILFLYRIQLWLKPCGP